MSHVRGPCGSCKEPVRWRRIWGGLGVIRKLSMTGAVEGGGLLFRDREKPPSPGLCGPAGPAYGREVSMPQHQEGAQRAFSFSSKAWRAGLWASPQSSTYSPCRVRPQGWGRFLPREEPASLLPVGTSVLEACRPCSMFPSGRLTEVCLFPWRSLLPCGWYPAVPGHPLDQVHKFPSRCRHRL